MQCATTVPGGDSAIGEARARAAICAAYSRMHPMWLALFGQRSCEHAKEELSRALFDWFGRQCRPATLPPFLPSRVRKLRSMVCRSVRAPRADACDEEWTDRYGYGNGYHGKNQLRRLLASDTVRAGSPIFEKVSFG